MMSGWNLQKNWCGQWWSEKSEEKGGARFEHEVRLFAITRQKLPVPEADVEKLDVGLDGKQSPNSILLTVHTVK